MKKTLIAATILLTISLMVCGIYYPTFPVMLFAGGSLSLEITRGVLVVLLSILLFSNPPRALLLRYGIGMAGVALMLANGILLFNYNINILDAILFLEVGVIFVIESLEEPQRYVVALGDTKKTALRAN